MRGEVLRLTCALYCSANFRAGQLTCDFFGKCLQQKPRYRRTIALLSHVKCPILSTEMNENYPICSRASAVLYETLLVNLLKPTVTWCTNSFNNCTFCPHCIYMFCTYLRTNSDLCHLHHKLIGFYNRDEKCFCAVRTASLNKAVCASSLKG